MADIPLLPPGAKFWMGFILGTWSSYKTADWNFSSITAQIDYAKSVGCNGIVHFGDLASWYTAGETTASYLVKRKQILDYTLSIGMYCMCYEAVTYGQWATEGDGSFAYPAAIPTAAAIIQQVYALLAKYPHVPGGVLVDEMWAVESATNTTPTIVSNMQQLYDAAKAGGGPYLPVSITSNQLVNNASPSVQMDYTVSQSKANFDSIAGMCDFFCFHPFAATTFSDSASLRSAFPNKEFIFPSSVAQDDSGTAPAICTSIMGVVAANASYRGMGYFSVWDYPSLHDGMRNSDGTAKASNAKALAFTAGVVGTYPRIPRRVFPGNHRVNNYFRWGFQ